MVKNVNFVYSYQHGKVKHLFTFETWQIINQHLLLIGCFDAIRIGLLQSFTEHGINYETTKHTITMFV